LNTSPSGVRTSTPNLVCATRRPYSSPVEVSDSAPDSAAA
jgi:hypothetical protein